jgi:hypothetical protein
VLENKVPHSEWINRNLMKLEVIWTYCQLGALLPAKVGKVM